MTILSKAEGGCVVLTSPEAATPDGRGPTMKISPGERNLQVARFYYTLNRLLNHPKNTGCSGLARLILYDGK